MKIALDVVMLILPIFHEEYVVLAVLNLHHFLRVKRILETFADNPWMMKKMLMNN